MADLMGYFKVHFGHKKAWISECFQECIRTADDDDDDDDKDDDHDHDDDDEHDDYENDDDDDDDYDYDDNYGGDDDDDDDDDDDLFRTRSYKVYRLSTRRTINIGMHLINDSTYNNENIYKHIYIAYPSYKHRWRITYYKQRLLLTLTTVCLFGSHTLRVCRDFGSDISIAPSVE